MDKKRFFAYFIALVYMCTINPPHVHSEESCAIRVASPVLGIELPSSARMESAMIVASEGGSVIFGDTEITIPPGALERDTEIAITRLPAVAETGEDLTNVTTDGGGRRFAPAGTNFK